MPGRESAVRIVVLAHDLLGTYGDLGNGIVAAARLRWRGHDAELIVHEGGTPVPEAADLYLLGGGEDAPQSLAFAELAATDALARAVEGGAVLLGVCAGYQLLGHRFRTTDGRDLPGFGLLDVETVPGGDAPRAVGEITVEPDPALGLPTLTGFENHGGRTILGPQAQPLGRVLSGVGNTGHDGTEGAHRGRVIGTYLHGPVLVRNPALADLLLSWVVGPLDPLDEPEVTALRTERLDAVAATRTAAARPVRVAPVSSLSFDPIAATYDATRGGEQRGRSTAAALRPWLPDDGPVCEIGIGTALVASALATTGVPVLGVDISTAMLSHAVQRFDGPIALADAAALPFAPGSLAAVYAVWVLHVVGDQGAVMAECHRVLRSRGRLAVVVTDASRHVGEPLFEELERRYRHRPDTLENLDPLAHALGLRTVHVEPLPPFRRPTTPNELAGHIELRTWSWLWDVPDDEWAAVVVPVIDALRAEPEPDRPRPHQNADALVVWER